MDKSSIQTVLIVLAIIGSAWHLDGKITANSAAIAEIKAAVNANTAAIGEIRREIDEMKSNIDEMRGVLYAHISGHLHSSPLIVQRDEENEPSAPSFN